MKFVRHTLTCCSAAFVFSSCASNLSSPGTAVSSAPAGVSPKDRAIAERIFSLVNRERAQAGKKALRGHNGLNRLAQGHSNQMGNEQGAANDMGSLNRAQYAYLRYSVRNLCEMTYAAPAGSGDPAAATVGAWSHSAAHRLHMLQSWDLTGIGVKSAPNGQTYVTMCMGAQPSGVPRSIQPVGWMD